MRIRHPSLPGYWIVFVVNFVPTFSSVYHYVVWNESPRRQGRKLITSP